MLRPYLYHIRHMTETSNSGTQDQEMDDVQLASIIEEVITIPFENSEVLK